MIVSLRRNVFWNLFEVIATGLGVFALYKFIAHALGLQALGVWSLVLATTSLARLADFGGSGGLGRYIAVSKARGSAGDDPLVYTETAIIFNTVLYSLMSAALLYPGRAAITMATRGPAADTAQALLPLALTSFAMMSIGNVLAGALMGFGRSDLRSKINVTGVSTQLAIAFYALPRWGLFGLAFAQLSQNVLVAVCSWFAVVKLSRGRYMLALPYRLRRKALKEVATFGLRLQVLNLIAFIYEPATKFAVSTYGGLSALGLFEMANRLVAQVRQLVAAPTMNITPIFTAALEQDPRSVKDIYSRAMVHVTLTGAVSMGSVIVASPFISKIWLGQLNWTFVTFATLLCVGWFVNLLTAPGYLLALGGGVVRWNVVGAVITSVGSPLLGVLLARTHGGVAAVFAASAAVAIGSWVALWGNCRTWHIPSPVPNWATYRSELKIIFGNLARWLATGVRP